MRPEKRLLGGSARTQNRLIMKKQRKKPLKRTENDYFAQNKSEFIEITKTRYGAF
jgi:hypothetical protein